MVTATESGERLLRLYGDEGVEGTMPYQRFDLSEYIETASKYLEAVGVSRRTALKVGLGGLALLALGSSGCLSPLIRKAYDYAAANKLPDPKSYKVEFRASETPGYKVRIIADGKETVHEFETEEKFNGAVNSMSRAYRILKETLEGDIAIRKKYADDMSTEDGSHLEPDALNALNSEMEPHYRSKQTELKEASRTIQQYDTLKDIGEHLEDLADNLVPSWWDNMSDRDKRAVVIITELAIYAAIAISGAAAAGAFGGGGGGASAVFGGEGGGGTVLVTGGGT